MGHMVVTREFTDDVGPHDRIRYQFTWDRGEIVDFVVQHETEVDGQFRPVVRYDTHHGEAHRDVLAPDGSVVDKEWLPAQWSAKDCFDYAANDLRNHWEWYQGQFLERYG